MDGGHGGLGFRGSIGVILGLYWGYIGRGYIRVILGLY